MRGSPRNRKKSRRKNAVLPVFVSFVCIIGVSFGLAWVWQNSQEAALAAGPDSNQALTAAASGSSRESDGEEPSGPAESAPGAVAVPRTEPSAAESLPEDETAPDSAGADIAEDTTRKDLFPNALGAAELAPVSYFDDAIFFGDSISTGIPLYNVMPNAKVVAYTGISTVNAATHPCIETDDGTVTMLEAAKEYGDKKKVYIMLGGNGLGYDKETFVRGYGEFIDAVRAQYPAAAIYIQNMTPVTDYAYKTYPSVSNQVIEEYNLAIYELALQKKVYYLDVASALMDEEGKLPESASPVDGMHFSPECYAKWFAFLRSHTVPVA